MFTKSQTLTLLIVFLSYNAICQTCPNLTFTALQVDCWTDNEIRFSYVFENNGTAPVTLTHGSIPNAGIQAYLSSDIFLTSDDLPAGGFSIGAVANEPLNPDEPWCGGFRTGGGTSSFNVDPSTRPYLILNIDQHGQLTECDESDNVIAARIPDQPCDFYPFFKIFAQPCNDCPDLSNIDVGDLNVVITNPVLDQDGNLLVDGSIAPPTITCPGNSRLHYSYDGFVNNYFLNLPDYSNLSSNSISARCVCNFDFTEVSDSSTVFIPSAFCPSISTVNANASVCSSSPISDQITTWQSNVETANATAIMNDNTAALVDYFTVPISNPVTIPNSIASGIHSGTDDCLEEEQKTYAYLHCYGPDGELGNDDDEYILLGTHTLTVYPEVQAPTIEYDNCSITVSAFCAGDQIVISHPVEGMVMDKTVSSMEPVSLCYLIPQGATANTIGVTLTSHNACSSYVVTLDSPACPIESSCTTPTQIDATASICSPGPITDQITTWQSNLETVNATALNDGNIHSEVLYSTEAVPSSATTPNQLTATGIHNEQDICTEESQKTYAYLWCFGDDGVSGNSDDNYVLLGTHTLNVRYPTQEPVITIQDCTVKVDTHCDNDAINFNGDTSDGIISGTSNCLLYTVNPGESQSEIIISITSPPNSCPVFHAIQETPSCPAYELEIADPCSCTNPQNYSLNNAYHFHETVEVIAATGQTWNMTAVTSGAIYDAAGNPISLPFAGTETTAGSGVYRWSFWHREVAGFCATYENESGSTLDNCNACFIPEPSVPRTTLDLGTFSCDDLSLIPACPTSIPEVLAGPYSVFWGGSSCEFTVTCVDDAVPLCNGPKQIINRTITLDRGDVQYVGRYTYCVESTSNANVTCDSIGIYVNTSSNKTIDPSSLVNSTEGFCSSNLSYSSSQSTFDCSDINGTGLNMGIPVLVTVEDDCGNSASCEAKVSVMLEYMSNTYGCSMCGVNSGKDFRRNGVDYNYRIEIIRGSPTENWNLVSSLGSEVYSEAGSLLTLPLQGIPVGCGLFLWEYWHTSDGQFEACYQEERTGRKVTGY